MRLFCLSKLYYSLLQVFFFFFFLSFPFFLSFFSCSHLIDEMVKLKEIQPVSQLCYHARQDIAPYIMLYIYRFSSCFVVFYNIYVYGAWLKSSSLSSTSSVPHFRPGKKDTSLRMDTEKGMGNWLKKEYVKR